jgi:hypothetical protein
VVHLVDSLRFVEESMEHTFKVKLKSLPEKFRSTTRRVLDDPNICDLSHCVNEAGNGVLTF